MYPGVHSHCFRSDILAYHDGQTVTVVDKRVGVSVLSVDLGLVSLDCGSLIIVVSLCQEVLYRLVSVRSSEVWVTVLKLLASTIPVKWLIW